MHGLRTRFGWLAIPLIVVSAVFVASCDPSNLVNGGDNGSNGDDNGSPVITSITCESPIDQESTSTVSVYAYDPDGDNLTYSWTAIDGGSVDPHGSSCVFQPPQGSPWCHVYHVGVFVYDGHGNNASDLAAIRVWGAEQTQTFVATHCATVDQYDILSGQADLVVGTYAAGSDGARGYAAFDFSDLWERPGVYILEGEARLWCLGISNPSSSPFTLYYTADDYWPSPMTWATQPGYITPEQSSQTFTGDYGWVYFPCTQYMRTVVEEHQVAPCSWYGFCLRNVNYYGTCATFDGHQYGQKVRMFVRYQFR